MVRWEIIRWESQIMKALHGIICFFDRREGEERQIGHETHATSPNTLKIDTFCYNPCLQTTHMCS